MVSLCLMLSIARRKHVSYHVGASVGSKVGVTDGTREPGREGSNVGNLVPAIQVESGES